MRNLRKEVRRIVREEMHNRTNNRSINEALAIPRNIKAFAIERGAMEGVKQIAKWLKKVGRTIVGGTAIGKNYSTLVLDITYHGGEIAYNLNDDIIYMYGEEIDDVYDFKRVFLKNNPE